MEIQAVSNVSIPSFSQALKVSYSGGSISIPVNDPISINARFKHITGVPFASENSSVPYYKLQQLDALIDQISKLRNREMMDIDAENIEREQLQDLINDYSYELRNRLNSMPAEYYYGIYSAGSILNMTA
jgi:hypothetical protein